MTNPQHTCYGLTLAEAESRFFLGENGLYKKNYKGEVTVRAGYYHANNDCRRVTIDGAKITEKVLVYFMYHGYNSDYRLFCANGDENNTGILNILEEGETLVRLNVPGVRYDPSTGKYCWLKIKPDLSCEYVGPYDCDKSATAAYESYMEWTRGVAKRNESTI